MDEMEHFFAQITLLEEAENPGVAELDTFLSLVHSLLVLCVRGPASNAFWEAQADPDLRELAMQTLEVEVAQATHQLGEAIPGLDESTTLRHGLVAAPARFKFKVIASLAKRWRRAGAALTIRQGFGKVVEAIDVVLNSLVDAAGGTGGLIKEFKDALLTITPEG